MILRKRSRHSIDTNKDTQFSEAWIVLGVLLAIAGTILDSLFLTTASLFLFVVAGISWLWAYFSLDGLTYRRRFSEVRAFQGETVELVLEVRNRKILPQSWVTVRDLYPPDLTISQTELAINPSTNLAEFSTFWMVGPYQRISRRFLVECTVRGFHKYGPATITTGDGFGFFNRQMGTNDEQRLIVYPRLYPVTELGLPSNNPFGEIRVMGSLFEDPLRTAGIRQWNTSDSLRRVHWKATARHQQLLSRIYEPSEEQVIQLFLNVATLERHWHGFIPELQERAISVAASLVNLAAEQRIAVGLSANGALPGSDQPIRLLPGRSPKQVVRILEMLAAVTPFATQTIETMLSNEAPRFPWGTTLVVVSAIAHDGLLAAIMDLSSTGRKIVLFTLAAQPPMQYLHGVTVYHLPHLVDDLIAPDLLDPDRVNI